MIAIGIDPSLTSTGLAVWDGDAFDTAAFPSEAPSKATLLQQHDRVNAIHSRLFRRLMEWDLVREDGELEGPVVIAIERLNFSGKQTGRIFDRAAHSWRLVDTVRDALHVDTVIDVGTSSLKLISTGFGKASKADMIEMAERLYGVPVRTDDEADAVHLAAIAAAVAGHPVPGWQGEATPERAKSFALSKAAYAAATR